MITDCERGFLLGTLTPAPRQVLALLAAGYTRQEICDELGINDKTLRGYLSVIYETFGTSNHVQLALIYRGIPLDTWRQNILRLYVYTHPVSD